MLGASRESINKELGALQSDQILSYGRGYFTLHDIDRLTELAEEWDAERQLRMRGYDFF